MDIVLEKLLNASQDPFTKEDVERYQTILSKSVETVIFLDDFYKLPIDIILNITKQGTFTVLDNVINFICSMNKHFKNETPLILNSINYKAKNYEELLRIFSCFESASICRAISDLVIVEKPNDFEPNFLSAVLKKDMESIKYHVLKLNVDVNQRFSNNETALFNAVKMGHVEVISFLCKIGGADTSIPDMNLITPLYKAVELDDLEAAKALVEYGNANLNYTSTTNNETPIYKAAIANRPRLVKYLISKGADVEICNAKGASPFFVAAEFGNFECLKLLREEGNSNPNKPMDDSCSPLYIAVQNVRLDVVRYLLFNCHCDINHMYKKQYTCLYNALERNSMELVKLLVEEGNADIELTGYLGITPLYRAVDLNLPEFAKYLISKGANVYTRREGGASLLYMAVERNNLELTKLFIEKYNIPVDWLFKGLYSALGHAAYSGAFDCVKYIVEHTDARVTKREYNEATDSTIKGYLLSKNRVDFL